MANRPRNGGLTTGWLVIWRQLRANPSVAFTILAATFIAVLFLGATPRLVERVADAALETAVTEPPVQQRSIAVTTARRINQSIPEDPFRAVRTTGTLFAENEFTPIVQSIIAEQGFIVDSPEFDLFNLDGSKIGPFDTDLRFRYQDGIEEHMTLVEGRLPEAHEDHLRLDGPECPEDLEEIEDFEEDDEVDCVLEELPVFEIAVSEETLSVLSFGLNEMVRMRPDATDPLFRLIPLDRLDYSLVLVITGVIELSDQDDDYWYGDARLHRASITENPDFRFIFATGLMDPTQYGALLREMSPAPWRYTWRYFVDPDAIDAADIETLSADLRNLELAFHPVSGISGSLSVVTRLPTLIDNYLGQFGVTAALMSLALAGVFSIAIALTLQLSGLATLRHRNPIILIRSRGASRGQMILTRTYQGLVMVAPAAVLAYLVGAWLLPGSDYLIPYRLTAAFATAAVFMFVFSSLPLVMRHLGSLQRENTVLESRGGARLVLEILVVVVAIGAAGLLRRRGQSDAADQLTFDPLLAVTPALLGLAAGLVTLRVYPYMVAAAARLLSRGRKIVAFVGLRRILQQPPVARIPIVVIVMAVGIAVFSILIRSSIHEGQEQSAWQAVGADYSIQGSAPGRALATTINLSDLESVEVVADGIRYPGSRITESQAGFVDYLAINAIEYDKIVSGTDGDPDLPDFLFAKRGPDSGTEQSPLPVVISATGWPAGQTPEIGDTFTLDVAGIRPVLVVEAVRDRWPGLPVGRPFIISDIHPIDALGAPHPISRTNLYVKAPPSAHEEIEAEILRRTNSARLESRYETVEDVRTAPLVAATNWGLLTTLGLSIALAAVAAISSLALSSATRRRDLGYLRTLGLQPNQATALTVIEQLPLLLIAVAVGGLAGVAMVVALQPAIVLDAFTGGLVTATIRFDWWIMAVSSLVLASTLAISIVIFISISGRDDLGRLLRVGDE